MRLARYGPKRATSCEMHDFRPVGQFPRNHGTPGHRMPRMRCKRPSSGGTGTGTISRRIKRRYVVGYSLGVDLGTTFTAAAIADQTQAEMVTLGDRSVVAPSVVFVREDGEVVTGEAAGRRAP